MKNYPNLTFMYKLILLSLFYILICVRSVMASTLPETATEHPTQVANTSSKVQAVWNDLYYVAKIKNTTNRNLVVSYQTYCQKNPIKQAGSSANATLELIPIGSTLEIMSEDTRNGGTCATPTDIGRNLVVYLKFEQDTAPSYAIFFHTEYHGGKANEHFVYYLINGENGVTADAMLNYASSSFADLDIGKKAVYQHGFGGSSGNVTYTQDIDVLKDFTINNDSNQIRYIKAFLNPYKTN